MSRACGGVTMTEGNFPGKECTKQLLLYLLTDIARGNQAKHKRLTMFISLVYSNDIIYNA